MALEQRPKRLRYIRRKSSPSEIVVAINTLINRINVLQGWPNDPNCYPRDEELTEKETGSTFLAP